MSGKQPNPSVYLPRLALQIGVTGHRLLGLDEAGELALQFRISTVLQALATAYQHLAETEKALAVFSKQAPLPPRLLTPLAEGADSLAAKAALSCHYALHCPLPFPREVYEKDFANEALQTFTDLLAQADRVLELDGVRERKDQAYRYVGRFVLRHSDILLAVWDGVEDEMSPGTAGVVAAALALDKPVLWIRPDKPAIVHYHDPREKKKAWQVLDGGTLTKLLRGCLLPPEKPEHEGDENNKDISKEAKPSLLEKWQKRIGVENHCCLAYFNHSEPHRTIMGTVYRTLFSWFGKYNFRFKSMLGNDYQYDASGQWQTLADAAQPELPVNASTQLHFSHADSLASYYADRYRGTFVSTFMLGAIAVLLALLGAPFKGAEGSIWFAPSELAIIGIIAGLVLRGRLYNFHQCWVDFRLLAERMRQYAFLAPIGGVSYSSQPVFQSHDDHSYALVDWLVRTISRADGIPAVSFNADYRKAYQDFLMAMIVGQAKYHENNHIRNERIAHVAHIFNLILLLAIVIACGIHIGWHENLELAKYSTIAAAVLPALGAAIAGILSQGEFERIAKRSKGMMTYLNEIKEDLTEHPDATVLELARQAQLVIDTMNQELYDWRVIFRAKPLEQHP